MIPPSAEVQRQSRRPLNPVLMIVAGSGFFLAGLMGGALMHDRWNGHIEMQFIGANQ